jgi:hypothetical protein
MGNLNFQDVLRDVHDPSNHALQISGTINAAGQATVTLYGTPTIYAVVNTGAAGDSTAKIGFATVAVSTPTLYAVVNTSAPGVGNSIVTIANTPLSTLILGNVTLSDPKTYIGSVSVSGSVGLNAGVAGIGFATVNVVNQPALVASAAFIGLVTVANTVTSSIVGNVTLSDPKGYIGLVTATMVGTVNTGMTTLFPGPNFIGLTTTVIGSAPTIFAVVNTAAAGDSVNNIGFATVSISNPTLYAVVNTGAAGVQNSMVTINPRTDYFGLVSVSGNVAVSSLPALSAGVAGIGFATVNVVNQPALVASAAYIGIATVNIGTIKAWANPNTYIGLVTAGISTGTANIGSVSILGGVIGLNAGTQFIGLVTAWSRNAGTTKTLVNLPVAISLASITTVVTPSTSNTIYITNMLLSSNATTQVRIRSGATYMTGNASLGVTLFPGGGFTQMGSPDSPSWVGLPSGALIIEKFDTGGIVSNIAGNVVYFQE